MRFSQEPNTRGETILGDNAKTGQGKRVRWSKRLDGLQKQALTIVEIYL